MRSANDSCPLLHSLELPADPRNLTVRQLRPLAAARLDASGLAGSIAHWWLAQNPERVRAAAAG